MGWVCLADYVWMYCTKAFHVLAFPSWWNTNPLQLNQHSSLCGTFCTGACHLLILEYYLVCDKLTWKKARSGKKGAQKSFKRGLPPGKWWHEIPPWDQLLTTHHEGNCLLALLMSSVSKQRHRNLLCSSLLGDPKRHTFQSCCQISVTCSYVFTYSYLYLNAICFMNPSA